MDFSRNLALLLPPKDAPGLWFESWGFLFLFVRLSSCFAPRPRCFLVIQSSFLIVGLVGLMSSRNNIVEMSSRVPEGMSDWLDSLVLLCVSVVDAEFCIELRKRHRICGNNAREEDYELVAPDSDERVCFPTSIERERPFFYAYEYFFSQLKVTFSFTAFETDLGSEEHILNSSHLNESRMPSSA